MRIFILVLNVFLAACSTPPKLDVQRIRTWSESLGNEYPQREAVIAHYQKNDHALFY
jgi:hypothetical protein